MINLLIPAAGNGLRMGNMLSAQPKAMLDVVGKPLIDHGLDCVQALSFNYSVVVIGKNGLGLRAHLLGKYPKHNWRFVLQAEPSGLVDAIFLGLRDLPAGNLLLMLSDEVYLGPHHEEAYRRFADGESSILIGVEENVEPSRVSETFALKLKGREVLAIEERPKLPEGSVRGTGCFFFKQSVVEHLRNGLISAADFGPLICQLLQQGFKGEIFPIADRFFNINTPEIFRRAEAALVEMP